VLRGRKRLVYGLATEIVAVSRAGSEDVGHLYRQPERKLRVFANSLADPFPSATAREGNGSVARLVCAAQFTFAKGQDVLIRALASLTVLHPQVLVEFLGDGPAKDSCIELAGNLGVLSRCRFEGSVRHEAVLQRMRSAAVTVLPSRCDNCPLVIIESLAVGTPVIASCVGGIPEIVRDGIDGFLVPPEDPPSLAAKLSQVLSDPALRQRMQANARQRFLSQFEQRRAVEQQADWLESIVRG